MARTFSTPLCQICHVTVTIAPTPLSTATLFQGSPTHIPSTSPAASAPAAHGGAIVTLSPSLSPSTPLLPSHNRTITQWLDKLRTHPIHTLAHPRTTAPI